MNVTFTKAAQADTEEIHRYIARENPAAASNVVAAIERATTRLSAFPLSGRIGAVETTRELVISKLPFIVIYRVTADTIEIIAVFHAAKDKPRGR